MAWALLLRGVIAHERTCLNHRITAYRALLLGALCLSAAPAWAALGSPGSATSATLFAAPVAHQAMPGQAGSLVRVTVALILVLAAVFAAAWFSRRMHGVGSSRSAALEVIAQLPLGPRERAVLVRVGTQQVLLGVASGNVRALHVLAPGVAMASGVGGPEGTSPTATDAAAAVAGMQRPTFKSMLLKSLGK